MIGMPGKNLLQRLGGLGPRLGAAMTGAAVAYPVAAGDSSLGQAAGETLGGIGGWNVASRLAERLPGPRLLRSVVRLAAPLAGSLAGGTAGGLAGEALPLYRRPVPPFTPAGMEGVKTAFTQPQQGKKGMDKLAELAKEAEVRGVLAAYVDQGLLKVASAEDFDALSTAVTRNLTSDSYTIDDIATTTDRLLAGGEKTAADLEDTARKAALGELLLKKMAGDIDMPTFTKEAGYLITPPDDLPAPARPRGLAKIPAPAGKGGSWVGKIPTKALLGAGIGAGVLTGGLLGKKLLDKHRARQQAAEGQV